jgi:hypothetical protein
MKLKKLLAAVVAGVLALTMAPIAISAAPGIDVSVGSPFNGFTFNIGGSPMRLEKIPNIGTGTFDSRSVNATLEIPFEKVSSGMVMTYNIPGSITNVAIGTLPTGMGNITTTADLDSSGFQSGLTQVTIAEASRISGAMVSGLQFTLTSSTPWKVSNTDGAEQNVTELIINVTVSIGTATPYNVSVSNATFDRGGALAIKDLSAGAASFGANINGGRAHENDLIKLKAPSTGNIANEGEGFASWRFSTAVEISTGTDYYADSSETIALKTDGSKKYTEVFGSGNDLEIIMPKGPLTITAYDTDGVAYGSNTPGSSSTNTNGQYLVTSYGTSFGTQYVRPGTQVYMTPTVTEDFQYFSVSGVPNMSQWSNTYLSFTMPENNVTIYTNNYNESTVTATTNGYGSASASTSTANSREIVTFTASSSSTSSTSSVLNDPYYYFYGGNLGTSSYYYPTYTYTFVDWSFNRSVDYVSGYSSTSNPTKVYMTTNDLVGTANFTYSMSGYPYYPTTPSTNNTTNSYTNNGATATINSSTGVVTAGINSSGSVNSTATNNALKAAINRKLIDGAATVVVPSTSTGLSKSTVQKLITAAGSKGLRIQIQGSFGTITVPVSTARQINTRVLSSSNALTSAKATFKRVFGNTDIVGIQTSQASTFGSSATYRISADAIGLGVDYGDTAYVAIYNPETGKYSKKTVMVNANGQIAFASSYSGIFLFSAKPFSAK